MNPSPTDTLQEKLNAVNERQDVLTDRAREAKQEYDQIKQTLAELDLDHEPEPEVRSITRVEDTSQLMVSVLRESRLDDLMGFLDRPGRLMMLNLCIGLIRGTGFFVAFVLMLFVFFYALGPDGWATVQSIWSIAN